MRLWILRPLDEDKEPFNPWYNKTFGVVVRAETEVIARALAVSVAWKEGQGVWLDPSITSCYELHSDDDPEVIIVDRRQA